MTTTVTNINIRDLYRNMKDITDRAVNGESFEVSKNHVPVFNIQPAGARKKKAFDVKAFAKLQFHSGEKNLSQRIDEIVYRNI